MYFYIHKTFFHIEPTKKDDTNLNNERSIEKRITNINETYTKSQDLAKKRHALLEDSICLYGFYRECDDFEKWIKDKEKLLKAEDKLDTVESAKRKYEVHILQLQSCIYVFCLLCFIVKIVL